MNLFFFDFDCEVKNNLQVARQIWQGSVVPCGGVGVVVDHVNEAESETKLYISNLDYGVSNGDIKVSLLFSTHDFFLSLIFCLLFPPFKCVTIFIFLLWVGMYEPFLVRIV